MEGPMCQECSRMESENDHRALELQDTVIWKDLRLSKLQGRPSHTVSHQAVSSLEGPQYNPV